MPNRQRLWILLTIAICFAVGLALVLNESGAGWFFFILGFSYLGLLTPGGRAWVASDPRLARWAIIGVIVLLGLLAALVAAVLLRR